VADENKSNTRVELAKDLLRKHQMDDASREAEQALSYNSSNEVAYQVLGLAEFLRGVDNYLLLEQQDCVTGVDAEVLREEMDGHFSSAAGHFARATELAPDYGDAWASRGLVAMQLENYEDAIIYFERAFDARYRLDQIGLTRAHLGWARFHTGAFAKAAKELRQALQFQPNMCVAKYRLGRVYFARKEWNKALEQFQAVARDNGCRLQEAQLYHLKTLIQLGMTSDLETVRQSCVALAPRSCLARECRVLRAPSPPSTTP
jgi:tetratricopeptide (TPR) repeat protein